MNAVVAESGTSRPVLSPHALVALHGDKLHLALDIADEGARTDIELYAPRVHRFSPWHYDTGYVDPIWRGHVDRAVIYLESRGLIEREAEQPRVVRVLDAQSTAAST